MAVSHGLAASRRWPHRTVGHIAQVSQTSAAAAAEARDGAAAKPRHASSASASTSTTGTLDTKFWADVPSPPLSLRGPLYLKNKKKIPATGAAEPRMP